MKADPFYVGVLKSALKTGALKIEDRVLVVCGGDKDEASLRAAGIQNFDLSNICGDVTVDVENLPHPNQSFDAVLVHSGLHHCASPHRGLLEMHRVAKRSLIIFEPADNFATKIGQRLGIGQTYEFAAVNDNGLSCGGWRNTSIPNWVYRFTASEIRQAICCAAPFGPHRFQFFYRTRIPWVQLQMRRNKIPLILVTLAAPFLRLFDAIGPVFSNNMAAVIVKPEMPRERFQWLEDAATSDGYRAKREWFTDKFGKRHV